MAVLIPTRHFPTRLWVQSGITGAFHVLPKAWFWAKKSLGSIKNSNRLLRKSVRTPQNRRRLSDSDFHCVFDAKRCGKHWKQGVFGVLASAVIFRQIPPGSVLTTWLENRWPSRARGFESHPLRHKHRFYAYFRIEPVFFFIHTQNRIQFIVYPMNRETGKFSLFHPSDENRR